MRKVAVCLSPELIHLFDIKNRIVVVVDIFRATSSMVTALANEVASITSVTDLKTCMEYRDKGYVIAGERNGLTAKGFELGNSPRSYLDHAYSGKKIAMTTTNGTLAIDKSKSGAAGVLVGSFLNLNATAQYLSRKSNDVLILCAGWKGNFNLEDSLYAGALVEALSDSHGFEDDGALAMRMLYQANKHDLISFLNQASHAKRLQHHGIAEDIEFCLSLDKYDLIGKLVGDELVAEGIKTTV